MPLYHFVYLVKIRQIAYNKLKCFARCNVERIKRHRIVAPAIVLAVFQFWTNIPMFAQFCRYGRYRASRFDFRKPVCLV